MVRMKVYICGPMTGIPQFNLPAFDLAALELRAADYEVVSPGELAAPVVRAAEEASLDGSLLSNVGTWGEFLARDVRLLADDGIRAVFVLPGWEASRGARLETFVAHLLDMPILSLATNEAVPLWRLTVAWTTGR